jgi:hypothetical protein
MNEPTESSRLTVSQKIKKKIYKKNPQKSIPKKLKIKPKA